MAAIFRRRLVPWSRRCILRRVLLTTSAPTPGGGSASAENWTEHRAESGHPYWFNEATQESVWERPAALAADAAEEVEDAAAAVERAQRRVLPFDIGKGVDKGGVRIYVGSWNRLLKGLKVFSLSSCALGVIGGPLLVFAGNASTPLLQRGAVAAGIVSLSLATTAVLHTCTKPYVHELWATPLSALVDDGAAAPEEDGGPLELIVTANKLSLFGGLYPTSFLLAGLGPNADHAFASHQVNDPDAVAGGESHSFFINIEDDDGWAKGERAGAVEPAEVQTLLRSRAQI